MDFQPSPYSYEPAQFGADADWSQVATTALEIGGSIAQQQLNKPTPAQRRAARKRKLKRLHAEAEAQAPEHSPMWPIAIGIVVVGGIGYVAMTGKKKE